MNIITLLYWVSSFGFILRYIGYMMCAYKLLCDTAFSLTHSVSYPSDRIYCYCLIFHITIYMIIKFDVNNGL